MATAASSMSHICASFNGSSTQGAASISGATTIRSTPTTPVAFGVFTLAGDTATPVFVKQVNPASGDSRVNHLLDGRTTILVNDLGKVLIALIADAVMIKRALLK